jgi:carbamoyl-phosphate synthase/aspartate carbamoyltransferase
LKSIIEYWPRADLTDRAACINPQDRDIFNAKLAEINEKTAISGAATTVEEALAVANNVTGYPVICRAAYALGGLGSGFANNDDELRDLCAVAFAISPQACLCGHVNCMQ